jgi:hypothetical protein
MLSLPITLMTVCLQRVDAMPLCLVFTAETERQSFSASRAAIVRHALRQGPDAALPPSR